MEITQEMRDKLETIFGKENLPDLENFFKKPANFESDFDKVEAQL